ncbi:5-oxoprolinase subunit PxpB [Pseudomonas agarici]|uniref:5-oxoprolinase subunit PxpB n=1 Tax=Pseudomonas agarici TaxID=46677 RepID=UPI001B7F8CB5|nr:5-oxoprolinase subunit PxpB [Pseudomonas agarici]
MADFIQSFCQNKSVSVFEMATPDNKPQVNILGSQGLLLDVTAPAFSEDVQRRVLAIADEAVKQPGVLEAVPGMNNLLIVYAPGLISAAAMTQWLLSLWENVCIEKKAGREIEVPVIYGGTQGEDLPELAERAQLDIETFIRLHSEAIYQVAAIGGMPGFPYLSGLDPRLATPRRSIPKMRLDVGDVIIGGQQAGIMPIPAPSGWHVIGHTDLKLFDANLDSPSLLRPGDRIRFSIAGIES